MSTFSVRDPRVARLARKLARLRGSTMTEAVITALENDLKRERDSMPLADRYAEIAADLAAKAGPNGREVTKDDIDAMWGQ
ncbi:type II toxin-antitoxin system VapB family antitoxin [Bradyrhizobium sp. DOA9]|uniref:type II toxin-antitoxin system VapB family antitoxin n=1 Tax=Bradyrhizobium sp. DOA9 TaxID=1126627 RepID=UPI0004685C07|nr:type II toxin-antitoxin system VapB family antitoxin [Bradyrhizobium sp. DOA9]